MNQEKEKFYDLLLADSSNAKVAMELLKGNAELNTVIEAELLPVLLSAGKKTLKTLPKFIEQKEKFLFKALRNYTLKEWKSCPPLLASFTHLDLSKKPIKTIPESIGLLQNLQELNLSNKKLTRLPDAIGNLQQLKNLILDKNKLTVLPDTIGQLQNLEVLDLGKNELSSLPDSISNLQQLKN